MKHWEFFFKIDGTKIFAQEWYDDNPKAVVGLIHGLGEHSGRYKHVGRKLSENGFALMSFDLYGHGKSEGKRGHTLSYDLLYSSINEMLKKCREKYPGKPMFLYGHSLGGNILLNYLLENKTEVSGAIVASPWLKLAFEPPKLRLLLAKLVQKIYPTYTESTVYGPKDICRHPDFEKDYLADPLVHDKITARSFFLFSESGINALASTKKFKLPLLLMHGTDDKVTSHKASREFAGNSNGHLKYKEWENLYHELHNEPEWEEVIQEVINWLESNLEGS